MSFENFFKDGELTVIGGVNTSALRKQLTAYLSSLGVIALDYYETFWQMDNNSKFPTKRTSEELFTEINNSLRAVMKKDSTAMAVIIQTHRETGQVLRSQDLDFAQDLRHLSKNIYFIHKPEKSRKKSNLIELKFRRHDRDLPEPLTLYWDFKKRQIISVVK